ncbi:E3 ubiquitin-protein ligase RING1-like [Durio zibethinus]|uniref:RING-type E3 ubiquitin transferase n=1 Tax=Durio zibethinus TaxID=66656 RepID=A0A6P6AFM7_DURZI|nr:E3 ubiquitin-protein ligase RING1-like [Durio zibethinus]
MGFQHRKLLSDYGNETYCGVCYQSCDPACYQFCPENCSYYPPYTDLYPPPPPSHVYEPSPHTKTPTKLLVITFSVLATAFLVLCYYVYYVRFSRRRSNARRRSQPETTETRDEFLDEDHGPIVDHHIWYINTVGLQPSIINSIAVCKYKRDEGLVEGTECSVCLNEFEEDETLRLLPKCSHAFHIPCIDTWLRSHTNCPMCRAPIVSNTANKGPSSSEGNTEDSGVSEETQAVIVEDDGEPERETDGGTSEIRIRTDEEEELAVEHERNKGESSGADDGIQPLRRSVSLDSLAASQINQALAIGIPEGSTGNSDNELGKGKESSVRIVSRRAAGNQGLLRLMCHSSIGRSLQNRQIFMKRSYSCNGKFSLPICNNKSRNTNPPVRSF